MIRKLLVILVTLVLYGCSEEDGMFSSEAEGSVKNYDEDLHGTYASTYVPLDSENIVMTDSKRVVYDPAKGTEVEASVFQRENLNPGDCVMGPAIIVESQTTTWISSEKKSSTQKDDCLLITKKTEAAK